MQARLPKLQYFESKIKLVYDEPIRPKVSENTKLSQPTIHKTRGLIWFDPTLLKLDSSTSLVLHPHYKL